MLTLAAYLALAVVIVAQAVVTALLWRSGLYLRGQKVAQSAVIWLVPIAGAAVVYAGLRHEEDVVSPRPTPQIEEHESLWGEGDQSAGSNTPD